MWARGGKGRRRGGWGVGCEAKSVIYGDQGIARSVGRMGWQDVYDTHYAKFIRLSMLWLDLFGSLMSHLFSYAPVHRRWSFSAGTLNGRAFRVWVDIMDECFLGFHK